MNAIFRRFYLKQDITCKLTLYINRCPFVNLFLIFSLSVPASTQYCIQPDIGTLPIVCKKTAAEKSDSLFILFMLTQITFIRFYALLCIEADRGKSLAENIL